MTSKTARLSVLRDYTLAQFSDALRLGVRADGARLYPAMPYTAYAKVTDDDAAALYAYFMRKVAPVDATPAPTNLPFPYDIRLSMAAWNLKSVPAIRDPEDKRAPYAWGDAGDELASIRGVALPDDPNRMTGAQLYDAWCASCHRVEVGDLARKQRRHRNATSTGEAAVYVDATVCGASSWRIG